MKGFDKENRFWYELRLTPAEHQTLCWLADRGYDGTLVQSAVEELHVPGEDDVTEETWVLSLRESAMWEVLEYVEQDPPAFLACLADGPLKEKILQLIEEVV